MAVRTLSSAALVAAVLAMGASVALAQTPDLWDNFTSCPPNDNWDTPVRQWGGNINGGAVPGNVACRVDPDLGKQVLVLTAHGDGFTGAGPVGVDHHGQPRSALAEWVDWKNPGYSHTCSPHCDVQRVGGAVMTRFGLTGGTFEARIKPCPQFGAASAMFSYNYTEVTCGDPSKPNVQNTCSPAYTKQCCLPDRVGGTPDCTINPNGKTGDVCRGTWVQNKEIDFEIPSSLKTGPGSVDPSLISFNNMRQNSVTAFPWEYTFHTQAGVDPPYESDNFVDVGFAQNDGNYHTYKAVWVPNESVTFYVDDKKLTTVTGPKLVPDYGHLELATWFPNAWAGSPTFDTCEMLVDYVKFTPLSK